MSMMWAFLSASSEEEGWKAGLALVEAEALAPGGPGAEREAAATDGRGTCTVQFSVTLVM